MTANAAPPDEPYQESLAATGWRSTLIPLIHVHAVPVTLEPPGQGVPEIRQGRLRGRGGPT